MSLDVEAGIHNEETIPLVKIVGTERHTNEEKDKGASCSEGTKSQCLNNKGNENDDKSEEIVQDMAQDQIFGSKMKYKIDTSKQKGKGTFKLLKMKTKSSAEEMAKDAEKFLKFADIKNAIIICVDDAEKITDNWVEMVQRIREAFTSELMFLTNGLGQEILSRVGLSGVKTICVTSTSFVTGKAVTELDHNKQCFGVFDHVKHKQSCLTSKRLRAALLLEDASPDDVINYKLAIFKAYSEVLLYCMKMITDGSKELLNSMADNSYFSDRRGVLIFKNDGLLSSVLYSFVEAFRNGSEMVGQAEEDVKSVCQEYFSENDRIDFVDLLIENIKQNRANFYTFDETEEVSDEKIKSAILHVIVKSLHAPITLLINSSENIYKTLSKPEYFKNNNTTLIFEKSGEIPFLLAEYLQCREKEKIVDGLNMIFTGTGAFVQRIEQNISKLKVYDANNPESRSMLSRVVNFVKKAAEIRTFDTISVAQKFSYPAFKTILNDDRPEIFENWTRHQMEIDTYILCNLRIHWHDKEPRKESKVGLEKEVKVAKHFDILNCRNRNEPEWQHMGTNINKAIEKLSNGIIANCFHEDGKPNVEIISPIQALIINRLFCMQLDFVKMLWKYDKENILVNTVMIWILINGILNEKIFARESAADDLVKLKKYFAAAIKWTLDEMLNHNYSQQERLLIDRIVLFRGQSLLNAAADANLCEFLTHTVTKQCISQKWNNHNMDDDNDGEVGDGECSY